MGQASELERGNYFLVNGEPVRIVRKEVVAVGTHSHTKLKFFVQGLLSKGEKIVTLGHTDKVDIVEIIRKSGQVVTKLGGNKVQVMDMHSFETFDATVADEELLNSINENDEVTFVEFNGNCQVIDKR